MSSITYTAADEIDRRAANRSNPEHKTAFPEGADKSLLSATGSELKALATPSKAKASKSSTTTSAKAESPKVPAKGKSVLGLTKAQTARRAKVIAQMEAEGLPIRGQVYHDRMAAAKVPTRRTVKA